MLTPAAAFAALAREPVRAGLWHAVRRPLFIALVQGVAISMVATRTVAAPVVTSVAAAWTTTVVAQFVAAVALIAAAPHRTVGAARALDLFFLGHAPWTLWLLACAAALTWASAVSGLPWIAVLTMVLPAAVTARIVFAFSRIVLGLDYRGALRRTLVHQAAMWSLLIVFLATAIQLWPRAIGMWR